MRGFGKNEGEWTGKVEISKEEITGGMRSIQGYNLINALLHALKGELLSSGFSTDRSLISVSAYSTVGILHNGITKVMADLQKFFPQRIKSA